MTGLGTEHNPLQVAVVGSGPSGFYSTEALIRTGLTVRVDMFERLPTPFGLVRSGVAPDHPKLKEAIRVYEKIAEAEQFSYFGNVTIGCDLSVQELLETHHAVIFTCGAESERRLQIPGAGLPGSYTATEFVGWYSGHPDYRDCEFDLSHRQAVIIGQGNVAADVCRVLAKSVDELARTDIAQHALDALSDSGIETIHIVGRRGPAQAKFTPSELRELGELRECDVLIDPADLELNAESERELEDRRGRNARKNLELFREFAARGATGKSRRCHIHFLKSPIELSGQARIEGVVLAHNRLEGKPFSQVARDTAVHSRLDCGILFCSIGYRGTPIPGVPFDEALGRLPNDAGRVVGEDGPVRGMYCAGWIKRGPTGIIGTNRADSVATVKSLIADLEVLDPTSKGGAELLLPRLAQRDVRVVNYAHWKTIDASEISRGESVGKPREKYTRVKSMVTLLD